MRKRFQIEFYVLLCRDESFRRRLTFFCRIEQRTDQIDAALLETFEQIGAQIVSVFLEKTSSIVNDLKETKTKKMRCSFVLLFLLFQRNDEFRKRFRFRAAECNANDFCNGYETFEPTIRHWPWENGILRRATQKFPNS